MRSAPRAAALLAILTASVAAVPLAAQTDVLPDGDTTTVLGLGPSWIRSFTIHNTSGSENSYSLWCDYAGVIASCSLEEDYVFVPANDSLEVPVTFTASSSGSGTVTLNALGFGGFDDGYWQITVPTYSVDVTYLSGLDTVWSGAIGTFGFTVKNLGSLADTFVLSCASSSNLTCGSLSPPSLLLAPNEEFGAYVNVTGGGSAGAGWVKLRATGVRKDSATRNVTVHRPYRVALIAPHGDRAERAGCPTIGAGAGSAVQCGDLLVAHALPAYRSRNTARSLTLLYNSATVGPRPVVALNYLAFPGDGALEAFRVEVDREISGSWVTIATTFFTADGTAPLSVKPYRFVVPVNADSLTMSTGAYPVKVRVYRKPVSQAFLDSDPDTISGRLLVVSRTTSPFGAGWWPAGVERLYPDTGGAMLVYGDGSALYFRKSGSSYIAPPGERSTLTSFGGTTFKRTPPGGRTAIWYAANGLPDSITDNNPTRNKATYAWSSGQLTSVTDPTGKSITVSYGSGTVTIGIPGVSSTTLTKNGSGDLTSLTDPDGFVTTFGYQSGTHRMTSSKARGTGTFTYTWDHIGRVATAVPPTMSTPAPTKTFRPWQRVGAPTASATGASVGSAAPSAHADTVSTFASWTRSGTPERITFKVDRFGLPVYIAPPSNVNATAITRDSIGQPILIRTFTGAHVQQEWNADGNLVRSIQRVPGPWRDRNATRYDTTRFAYHSTWKTLTKITPPLAQDSVVLTYDSYGRRDTVRNGRGYATSFQYTTDGLLAKIVEPAATGLFGGQHDTLTTVYSYHATSKNLTTIAKGSRSTTYVYDATNHSDVTSVEDAEGGEVAYTYDGIKRVLAVTSSGPLADATVLAYDYLDASFTKVMTTPDGRETTWLMDSLGRVTSECRPNGCFTTGYGDGVNPTAVFKAGSATTTFVFNASGQITKRQSQADTVDFVYNADGGLAAVNSGRSRIQRQYDVYGRLTCERQQIRRYFGEGRQFVVSNDTLYLDENNATLALPMDTLFRGVVAWHDYDAMGRRRATYLGDDASGWKPCEGNYVEQQFPDPNDPPDMDDPSTWYDPPAMPASASTWVSAADSMGYTYDAAGNLQHIKNAIWSKYVGGANTWTYTSDAKDRVTTLTLPHGSIWPTWKFNAAGDLAAYSAPSYSADTLSYDDVGRIASGTIASIARSYVYDGIGRLTSETTTWTNDFTYDSLGNRTSDANHLYEYGDELTQSDFGRLLRRVSREYATDSIEIAYDYDVRGNLIAMGSESVIASSVLTDVGDKLMEYDKDDKMVRQRGKVGSSTITGCGSPFLEERVFWYDGQGRRIFMRSLTPCSEDYGVHRYYWLDDHVVAKVRSNVPPDSLDVWWPRVGTAGQWYFYGPGMDNPLASRAEPYGIGGKVVPETRFLYVQDHRGSVIKAICVGSTTCDPANNGFDAFGNGGANGSPGYNGAEATAGFVYMRNRWYDPNTGRFTQEDPIGYAGGINLYGYAGNDPVTYSDPFGLFASASCEPFCTMLDVALLAADVADIRQNGLGWGNGIGVALGVISTAVPFLSGLGAADDAVRGGARLLTPTGGGHAGREFASRVIRDVSNNPENWKTVGAFTEAATGKKAKGGISIQTILENEAGERVVRHTVRDKSGNVIDDHYRAIFKSRDVDRPNAP